MAPKTPKGRKTDGETLAQGRDRMAAASPAERTGEKRMIAKMSGTECRAKLTAMGVDHTGITCLGAVRMVLSHRMGLGATPEKVWTPKAIHFAVREMFKQTATEGELKGKLGRALLKKLIAEDGDNAEKVNKVLDYGEDKFSFGKLSPGARRKWAELCAEEERKAKEKRPAGKDESTTDVDKETSPPGPKKQKGPEPSTTNVWFQAGADLGTIYAEFESRSENATLTNDPKGWEQLFNRAAATEYDGTGVHFFTTTVQILQRQPKINEIDTLGYGVVAAEAGEDEYAYEWLCGMYSELVDRMGSGRTMAQLRLSNLTRKAIAGGGNKPARPQDLACLFLQIMAAGDRHCLKRPFKEGNRASIGSSSGEMATEDENVVMSEEAIQAVVGEIYKGAAHGVQRKTVERAIRAQAAQAGPTFTGKQLAYFNNFTGKTRGVGMSGSDGGHYYQTLGCKIAGAHLSLAAECIVDAKVSRETLQELNLLGEDGKRLVHSLALRDFAGKGYRTSRLIPKVAGITAAVLRQIEDGFGSFENCERRPAKDELSTVESDVFLYVHTRTALERMQILDTCTADPGFRDRICFWLEEMQGMQASKVPYSMIANELGGLLAAAQRQRMEEISFGVAGGIDNEGLCLSFRPTREITAGEQRLMGITRSDFMHNQALMVRMFNEAAQRGLVTPPVPQQHQRGGSQQQPKHQQRQYNDQLADRNRSRNDRRREAASRNNGDKPKVTVVKKEQTPPKDSKPSGGGRNPYDLVPQAQWARAFKDESDKDGTVLCWFHNHRMGGCSGGYSGKCIFSHERRPKMYNDKAWDDLTEAEQAKIVAHVVKA